MFEKIGKNFNTFGAWNHLLPMVAWVRDLQNVNVKGNDSYSQRSFLLPFFFILKAPKMIISPIHVKILIINDKFKQI